MNLFKRFRSEKTKNESIYSDFSDELILMTEKKKEERNGEGKLLRLLFPFIAVTWI